MNHILEADFLEILRETATEYSETCSSKISITQAKLKTPIPSFQKVGNHWSIRICKGYRAVAREEEDAFVWFWIGKHD